MSLRSARSLALFEALLAAVLEASSYIGLKIGQQEMSPLAMAALRNLWTFIVLSPVLLVTGTHLQLKEARPRMWAGLLVMGVLGYCVSSLLINWPGWRPSPSGDRGKPIRAEHGGTCARDGLLDTLASLPKAPGDGLKQFREFALLQPRMFQRFHRVIVRWVKAFHVHRPRAGVTCPGRYTCSGLAALSSSLSSRVWYQASGVSGVQAFSDKLPPLGGSHLTVQWRSA